MHILIILAVIAMLAPLLYHWLIGQWFARVLMGIIVVPITSLVPWMLIHNGAPVGHEPSGGLAVFIIIIGGGLGWCIASLPVWIARHRDDSFHEPPNYNLTIR